jgi:hypothetical protein
LGHGDHPSGSHRFTVCRNQTTERQQLDRSKFRSFLLLFRDAIILNFFPLFSQIIPEQQAAPPVAKPLKTKSKNSTNSSTPARSAKAQEAAKAREEARRKMMEERRKLAKAKKNDDWSKLTC